MIILKYRERAKPRTGTIEQLFPIVQFAICDNCERMIERTPVYGRPWEDRFPWVHPWSGRVICWPTERK